MADDQTFDQRSGQMFDAPFDERSGSGLMFDPASYEGDDPTVPPPPWLQGATASLGIAPAAGTGVEPGAGPAGGGGILSDPTMKALQDEQAGLMADRKKALDPRIAQLTGMMQQPSPPPPQLQAAPKAPEQQIGKGAMEFMQVATIFGALAGLIGRRGATTSLNAFAGAIAGFSQGNLEVFKAKSEEWKQATQEVTANNQNKLDQYNLVWKDKKLNIDQKMEELKLIASQYGDEITYNLAEQRNYTMLAQTNAKEQQIQESMKQKSKMVEAQVDKMRAQVEQMHGAHADAMTDIADRAIDGDPSAMTAMGRSQGLYAQVQNRIAERLRERGLTVQDMENNKREWGGKQREQSAIGQRAGAIAIAVKDSQNMIPLAEKANAVSQQQGKRNGIAAWNAATNSWAVQKGDENFGQLVVYTNSLITIYARAQGGGGTGTVEQREHAREMLNPNQPPHTYSANLRAMANDLHQMSLAPNQVRQDIRQGGPSEPPSEGSLAGPPPASDGGGWKIVQ
jgi:hypothetical protein